MLLMLCGLSAPAIAGLNIGPTSSAKIGISLSVAPRFTLAAAAPTLRAARSGEAGRLCIVSNGQPMLLPVMLVSLPMDGLPVGQAERERADQLHRCDAARLDPLEAPQASEFGEAPALLIVSPE